MFMFVIYFCLEILFHIDAADSEHQSHIYGLAILRPAKLKLSAAGSCDIAVTGCIDHNLGPNRLTAAFALHDNSTYFVAVEYRLYALGVEDDVDSFFFHDIEQEFLEAGDMNANIRGHLSIAAKSAAGLDESSH